MANGFRVVGVRLIGTDDSESNLKLINFALLFSIRNEKSG